ncbi:MAG: hypothetical protein QM490_03170 [Candidatus Gracilibacteria bacterium]
MNYEHTQKSKLFLFAILSVIILFSFILIESKFEPFLFLFMGVILFIIISFISLTVIINEKYLKIKFGYGIFKKKFLLSEIKKVKAVRNHWYFGWGIRVWFWPYMRIYNVSGFDAVEIRMFDGKIYRIGTDEPKQLEEALLKVITKS